MDHDQISDNAPMEALPEKVENEPRSPVSDSSSKDTETNLACEQSSPRGQKRPLNDVDGNNGVSTSDTARTMMELPPGVEIVWKDDNAVTATFRMVETSPRTIDGIDSSDSSGGKKVDDPAIQLCLVGRARIRCLEGTAEVLGHTMTPESKEVSVSSPFWSNWMTIVSSQTATKLQISSIRGSPSFRLVPPHRPTVIPSSWKMTADQICEDFIRAPPPFRESLEDDSPFMHPNDPVVIICGAKGVGKSTFLRYLNNRLLLQSEKAKTSAVVAILDADVGQPELAPPGVLRLSLQRRPLLHPPYWNFSDQSMDDTDEPAMEQISAVYFGAVTSKVDPNRYLDTVQRLVEDYRTLLAQSPTKIPLLVNLDGWIKGMGFQILTTLISSTKPSHVCQLLGDTKAKMFDLSEVVVAPTEDVGHNIDLVVPTKAATTITAQLFYLDVCTKHVTPCSIPPSTLRTLRLAAYFGPSLVELWDTLDFLPAKLLQTGWSGDDDCTLARHLARERPYCVPMEAVQLRHSNTCITTEWDMQPIDQRETQYIQALNGSIVGLSTAGEKENCLGLGIVRSIDRRHRLFYILTPVPSDQLSSIHTLVGGNIPLPLPLVFRGVYGESFPYLMTVDLGTTSTGSTDDETKNGITRLNNNRILGSEPMKSRNNIGRRGFLGTPGGGGL